MKYITTTELRTKSKELIDTLRDGDSVTLIHRSQEVAVIQPQTNTPEYKTVNVEELDRAIKELNLPQLSDKQREKNYRQHIEKKYGKNLLRHK